MPKTITQKIVFKNTSSGKLYDMFLDSKHHAALTGTASAKISGKEGAKFSVCDDYAKGKNLQLIPGKLIIQSWYASDWEDREVNSTFILLFEQNGKDTIIFMTHANIPDKEADDIKQGWTEYYWKPWKKYLSEIR